jgi:hypothetical protein
VWDDCRVASGVTLERCIVAHGVELTNKGEYRDVVITPENGAGQALQLVPAS